MKKWVQGPPALYGAYLCVLPSEFASPQRVRLGEFGAFRQKLKDNPEEIVVGFKPVSSACVYEATKIVAHLGPVPEWVSPKGEA